jgi:DNA-binding IclR family transcriptional regulator
VHQLLPVQREQLFALVARHPMLTRQQLAALLNTSAARMSHLVEQLVNQGWVRAITRLTTYRTVRSD